MINIEKVKCYMEILNATNIQAIKAEESEAIRPLNMRIFNYAFTALIYLGADSRVENDRIILTIGGVSYSAKTSDISGIMREKYREYFPVKPKSHWDGLLKNTGPISQEMTKAVPEEKDAEAAKSSPQEGSKLKEIHVPVLRSNAEEATKIDPEPIHKSELSEEKTVNVSHIDSSVFDSPEKEELKEEPKTAVVSSDKEDPSQSFEKAEETIHNTDDVVIEREDPEETETAGATESNSESEETADTNPEPEEFFSFDTEESKESDTFDSFDSTSHSAKGTNAYENPSDEISSSESKATILPGADVSGLQKGITKKNEEVFSLGDTDDDFFEENEKHSETQETLTTNENGAGDTIFQDTFGDESIDPNPEDDGFFDMEEKTNLNPAPAEESTATPVAVKNENEPSADGITEISFGERVDNIPGSSYIIKKGTAAKHQNILFRAKKDTEGNIVRDIHRGDLVAETGRFEICVYPADMENGKITDFLVTAKKEGSTDSLFVFLAVPGMNHLVKQNSNSVLADFEIEISVTGNEFTSDILRKPGFPEEESYTSERPVVVDNAYLDDFRKTDRGSKYTILPTERINMGKTRIPVIGMLKHGKAYALPPKTDGSIEFTANGIRYKIEGRWEENKFIFTINQN